MGSWLFQRPCMALILALRPIFIPIPSVACGKTIELTCEYLIVDPRDVHSLLRVNTIRYTLSDGNGWRTYWHCQGQRPCPGCVFNKLDLPKPLFDRLTNHADGIGKGVQRKWL